MQKCLNNKTFIYNKCPEVVAYGPDTECKPGIDGIEATVLSSLFLYCCAQTRHKDVIALTLSFSFFYALQK